MILCIDLSAIHVIALQVLARDGGFPISNNGTATLLVYIEDANDNRPIFNPGRAVIYNHRL